MRKITAELLEKELTVKKFKNWLVKNHNKKVMRFPNNYLQIEKALYRRENCPISQYIKDKFNIKHEDRCRISTSGGCIYIVDMKSNLLDVDFNTPTWIRKFIVEFDKQTVNQSTARGSTALRCLEKSQEIRNSL